MKALVTGGGGFLGGAIVRQLLARGDTVRSLSRGNYPELRKLGVETFQADAAKVSQVIDAVKGCDVVFHIAAKTGISGSPREFDHANVDATQSVISACKMADVPRLVFSSSPSVIYAGQPIENGDESLPYPDRFDAHYPRTKALAERLVLGANGRGLMTVALRPHLIWGPGDTNLVPRIIERAKTGKLRLIGTGEPLIDTTYIDNAAEAHILAADKLQPKSNVAGKIYFITNGEPQPVGTILNKILAAAGLPPLERSISPKLAYAAGAVAEIVWPRSSEPPMTRFLAQQLSTAHWFNIDAARRDLGYEPKVSLDEGFRRLAESLKK